MSFFQTNHFTNESQNSPSSSLRQFKFNHRKQIRRQYIETFQKNKRKQLFKNNERYFVPQTNEKEEQFIKYLETLTVEVMEADPNNHLTYLNDVICSESSSAWVRNNLGAVMVLVHKLIEKMVLSARDRVICLKKVLSNYQNEMKEESLLGPQIIVDTLVYNEVFFQPLCSTRQLYFKQTNPYNPLEHSIGQQNSQEDNRQEELQKKKLNLYVFLQLLIAVTYEMTPESFVKSLKKHHTMMNSSTVTSNWHERIYINENNQYDEQAQLHKQATDKMIRIYYDLSNLTLGMYKIAKNIRYQNTTLLQLSNKLTTLYQTNSIKQNPLYLPFLWFDVQKMFAKQSTQQNIMARVLQYLVNLTSLVSMNDEFDELIHDLCLLHNFNDQAGDDVCFNDYEIKQISALYANLASEEIAWAVGNKEHMKERLKNSNSIKIEEQKTYNQLNYKPHSPGIYQNLLELFSNNWLNLQKVDDVVYIIKTILDNYDLPKTKDKDKECDDFTSSKKLLMYPTDCDNIAEVVACLFQHLTSNQVQSQFLPDLFVLVCQKLLPYLLFQHQLSEILRLVIRNENRRITAHCEKYKQSRKSVSNTLIQQQKQKKKKRIMTQNLKQIIISCSQMIKIYHKQTKVNRISLNGFSMINTTLDSQVEMIPKDIILSIFYLWEQNQLEYCYKEFVLFVLTVVQTFPEYVMAFDINKQMDDRFINLLEGIGSTCQNFNLQHQFADIMENVMAYLCNLDMHKGKQKRDLIYKYLVEFQDEWKNLLQYLEGVMYGKKCSENQPSQLASRISSVYDIIEKMLNDSRENMDVQI